MFCIILSEIRRFHVISLFIGWQLLCANNTFFSTKQMNKCIRMGIPAFKIVIWGGKSLVLWSQIMFYGSPEVSQQNIISNCKTANLPTPPTNDKFECSYPLIDDSDPE